ncbi:hypothetical protein Taro_051625 [Colocasia esculenta]|uniref:CRM domain-containing protein n=1 Tax=Colocasia esculenta TaxID=4460 RepID=A0A843XHF1_COLES|nr:hypothetical protein [Colocasia esculenta]
MWAVRSAQWQFRRAGSLLRSRILLERHVPLAKQANNEFQSWAAGKTASFYSPLGFFSGSRAMSTTKGRSMRSKVEKRMRRETGKTLREMRRARKLRKKLMTDEERLMYNLRRVQVMAEVVEAGEGRNGDFMDCLEEFGEGRNCAPHSWGCSDNVHVLATCSLVLINGFVLLSSWSYDSSDTENEDLEKLYVSMLSKVIEAIAQAMRPVDAKKKVALLLQKLKKYELPELPAPRHDPELLTPEQLQAYKKIGFRNRNYVPVGVRGVFGGVVQNMHLHWKFHETVQVCCDNFPKEKIKEMATMIARLSGGIVVNVHDVKTIIMFRGRNYRQPKNLIPINTLTKRKALFKARFEQALESQKLNIKKIEQELRRKGVNPEDPVAMASIQRVASTFFRAIDEKQGTPYVFHGERQPISGIEDTREEMPAPSSEDSDQEELDRFIAEIEDAADKEWAAEEAAEKEEASKIRYWNREDMGTWGSRRTNWSGDDLREDFRGRSRDSTGANSNGQTERQEWDNDVGKSEASGDEDWDSDDEVRNAVSGLDRDADSSEDSHFEPANTRVQRNRGEQRDAFRGHNRILRRTNAGCDSELDGNSQDALWDRRRLKASKVERRDVSRAQGHSSRRVGMDTESDDDLFQDSDDESWESDHEKDQGSRTSRGVVYNYHSSSDEED